LKIFLLCLASFIILFLLVDLLEHLDDFIKHSVPAVTIIRYFLLNIPFFVYQVSPLGVLLCTFLTIGIFVRHNEITALKAHGISLFRVFNIFLFISILVCVFFLGLQEYMLPYTNRELKEVKNVQIKGKKSQSLIARDHFWYRNQNAIFNIEYFDPSKNLLQGITIYYFTPDFILERRIDAESAVWRDGEWVFQAVMLRTFQSHGVMTTQHFQERKALIHENPQDFKMSQKESEAMSYKEIKRFIKKLRNEGYNTIPYEVDLHAKISYPCINIIMAILGIPFALRIGRSGGMALGIAASIFFGLIYWTFFAFCVSLGKSGSIPPFIAAWAANAAFSALGVYMFLQIRQ
jgi:lipopolysaccharide export system permease protein